MQRIYISNNMSSVSVKFLLFTLILCAVLSSAHAGEWMSRMREAFVDTRLALYDENPDRVWEHVDRQTRQDAGIVAAHIRAKYDSLDPAGKKQLQDRLGITADDQIRAIQGKDILVSKAFLEMHANIVEGERETGRRDFGTGMTGLVSIKRNQTKVKVTYTVERSHGGQAMDYRAQLEVPKFEEILGPLPPLSTPAEAETKAMVLSAFAAAQSAFASQDLETLWKLLDCESQSQADHFADQAQTKSSAERLAVSPEVYDSLNGQRVWALPWSIDYREPLSKGVNPVYIPASGKNKKAHLDMKGPFVEVTHHGRIYRYPFALNYRNGLPEYKLVLRPAFYTNLRVPKEYVFNSYSKTGSRGSTPPNISGPFAEGSSDTMGREAPQGAFVLFDGSSLDALLDVQMHTADKYLQAFSGGSTKETFKDFELHLEFVISDDVPVRAQTLELQFGDLVVVLRDAYGLEFDNNGVAIVPETEGKKKKSKASPVYASGALFKKGKRSLEPVATSQLLNHSQPKGIWQTLDLKVKDDRATVKLNGATLLENIDVKALMPQSPEPILLQSSHPMRNLWVHSL